MNNKITKIATGIVFIIAGIITISNPTLTENKFGFGNPYNIYLGISYSIFGFLFTFYHIKTWEKK